MLTHRGFSAWITCEGETVNEYLVATDDNTHSVQCWIPCDEGKSFSINWSDNGSGSDTCSFITLDGFVVPGRFLFGTGTASRSGVRTGPASERGFVFATVEEADTEGTSLLGGRDIGMITLRIKRVERVGSRPANEMQCIPPSRGLRSGDVCVGFGVESEAYHQFPSTWQVYLCDKPSTYVSFTFRYRSKAFLVSQGIMPAADAGLYMFQPKTSGKRTRRRISNQTNVERPVTHGQPGQISSQTKLLSPTPATYSIHGSIPDFGMPGAFEAGEYRGGATTPTPKHPYPSGDPGSSFYQSVGV